MILAGIAPAVRAENGEAFVFDVQIASICLDGTYPVTIATSGGDVTGNVTLTTDERGKLSGTLTADGTDYAATGKIKLTTSGTTLKLTCKASKKETVTLKGTLTAGSFSGPARGKGALGAANTFDMDVSTAPAAVASVSAVAVQKKRGRLGGVGTATVCGNEIAIKVSGKSRGTFSITFRGGRKNALRVQGNGDHVPGSAVLTLTTKGYGSGMTGAGVMNIDTILPPSNVTFTDASPLYEREDAIDPNIPSADGDTVTVWSVSPALPTGLSIDVATGVITGAPDFVQSTTSYTVTAANLAGDASADLAIEIRENRAYSLAPQQNLTDADIQHFLNRTQWAVSEADVANIRTNGLEQYLDAMLVLPSGTQWETDARDELEDTGDPQGLVPNTTEVARWWSRLMMTSGHPFQEVLATFWHDHLAVGAQDLEGRQPYMIDYVNLLRHDGAGNFKDLMVDVSRNYAMLRYLDNYRNTRTAPNENYGREFWELFTAGVDNGYTQADIVESARAFTGWRERSLVVNDYPNTGQSVTTYYMEFDPNRHDVNDKTILGQLISGQNASDDFQAVADITFANLTVEDYICRKFLEWFAFPEPSDTASESLGQVFRDGGWEIAPVLKTLFLSEAFFSERARGSIVKNPVEFGIGFVRTTGLQIPANDMDSLLNTLAMRPSQPPVVDGWPEGVSWLSAQSMVDRTNLVEHAVNNEMSYQNGLGIDVADLLPPPGQQSAAEVVDALVAKMAVTLSPGERQDLLDYMTTALDGGVVVASPWDPNNGSMVNERVRGVLYILAQHPTYHVR